MPVGHLYIFEKTSMQVLCFFLNWVVCLVIELLEFFMYAGDETLLRYVALSISSLTPWVVFSLLMLPRSS